jgi:integrase
MQLHETVRLTILAFNEPFLPNFTESDFQGLMKFDKSVKLGKTRCLLQHLVTVASVIKYPSGRYWIAAFRDASGRQHRRTTREIDRKRAQAVAEKFEMVAKSKGSPQRVRQIFSEFYRDHYGEELPFASVRKYALEWLATRKAETSPATHRRYGEAVQKFLSFLGVDADKSLEEVSRTQIAAFRDTRIQESAVLTANSDLKIIRAIFRSARRDGYLFQDPAEGIKPVKNREPFVRHPFSLDQLRAVLSVADSEWQSLIKFGLYTGQRLGDLALLTWNQIDLERDEIRLTVRKTGKQLLIPIAASLREHLLAIAADDNPRSSVHPRSYAIVTAQKGKVAALSDQFSDLLAAAGLRPHRIRQSTGTGRPSKRVGFALSFHSLRHTAVSLLKDAGVPDAVVMALVGHESAAMSHRYTHVGKEALARAAESLPEI